ncbi:MAG: bacillithiol system redox-active protein YtxJ [Bacteroidota bacterium]
MNWTALTTIAQIKKIAEKSKSIPCLIFKHSLTCPISSMAKHRVEKNWDFQEGEIEAYYLDLLNHRNVSNEVAAFFSVQHQSPQVLLIQDGYCTFDTSHLDITVEGIRGKLQEAA